ncbi:MAG: FkbM family methyltransferase [Silicimonas sp.]|nr:FkbM family methyltransferase [Silicimonas sp.]
MRRLIRQAVGRTRIRYADTAFELHVEDNYTEFVLWLHQKPPEHAATMHYRQKYEGQNVTIVDVGANAGIFSLPILTSTAGGSTGMLFEPNPEMIGRLKKNIALNQLTNVHVAETAVGDSNATVSLCLPRKKNLGQAKVGEPSEGEETIEVPLTKLHDALTEKKVRQIDLLKVDIEGLEDKALVPFLETAPPTLLPTDIYFEDVHSESWSIDLISALKATGYKMQQRFGHNVVYSRAA